MSYRPDIDGLRAIAIISVLGYHAFPLVARGGFIGVDIFFVISGFLITSIVTDSQARGGWSYVRFYALRIRRLFPALLVLLIVCLAWGTFLLSPEAVYELRREAVASGLFASNFFFMMHSGYFDGLASSKPLLHLWSLGIEEQFYLVWPLLLAIALRLRLKAITCLGVIAASFIYCLVLLQLDSREAFYSPLSRAWEFAIGALLVEGDERVLASLPKRLRSSQNRLGYLSIFSLIGTFLLVGGVVLIDDAFPFPGWLTLIPVSGTMLVIAAGPEAVINRSVLSSRWLVYLGLISYPLYLWHWPILFLARTLRGADLSPASLAGCLLLAGILAAITYEFIERPLRQRLRLYLSAAFLLAAMMLVTLAQAFWKPSVQFSGDMAFTPAADFRSLNWFGPERSCIDLIGLEPESIQNNSVIFCKVAQGTGPITVAVIGDSMANSLYPGLKNYWSSRGERVINIGNSTCAPFRRLVGISEFNRHCDSVNAKIYAFLLSRPEIKIVIWSFAPWDISRVRLPGTADSASLAEKFSVISSLEEADGRALLSAGKRVIVSFDTPNIGIDPWACWRGLIACETTAADVASRMEPFRTEWQTIFSRQKDICVFSQDALFRSASGGYTAVYDKKLMFRDGFHLSYAGSDFVASAFAHSRCAEDSKAPYELPTFPRTPG